MKPGCLSDRSARPSRRQRSLWVDGKNKKEVFFTIKIAHSVTNLLTHVQETSCQKGGPPVSAHRRRLLLHQPRHERAMAVREAPEARTAGKSPFPANYVNCGDRRCCRCCGASSADGSDPITFTTTNSSSAACASGNYCRWRHHTSGRRRGEGHCHARRIDELGGRAG